MKKKVNKEKNKTIIDGMKRPKFIVFTDKDGTLNLADKDLSNIIKQISAMGGMVIPITGRTVGDIKEDFETRKIALPKLIIGDNGANIYSTITNKFVIKKTLEKDNVKKIIECFTKIGGNPDLIRYTDGSNIYASKEENVKKYYKGSKTAKFNKNIYDEIMNSEEITKITLAGSKDEMEEIAEFAETLGFWTDMDITRFPGGIKKNYRLDIADKNINKGKAVEAIVEILKPEYGYICVGNGYNDLSMFKQAINDGMIAAIMNNAETELINEVQKYANTVGKNRNKVNVIPNGKNKANKWILKRAKRVENCIRVEQLTGVRNNKKEILPNVQRVEVKPPHIKNRQNKNGNKQR